MHSEELPEDTAPAADRAFLRALLNSASFSRAICLTIANIAAVAMVYLSCRREPLVMYWQIQILIACAALLSSVFVAVHQWIYWAMPAERLRRLLPLVRRGIEPIDELAKVRGGVTGLAAEAQELLRELRQRRAEVSQLEEELNQRVASRTDALERSLGVMKQHAARDALTGLLNRRTLDETLPLIIQRCRTEKITLSVMMIDVDNFKPLNDTLGHAAGDDLLRSLGQLFRSTLQNDDAAFRYGGDEFVILLPRITHEEAKARGWQLTKLVESMTATMAVEHPPQLSIGLLDLADVPDADAQRLLHEADRLLYRIKAARRRRRSTDVPRAAAG